MVILPVLASDYLGKTLILGKIEGKRRDPKAWWTNSVTVEKSGLLRTLKEEVRDKSSWEKKKSINDLIAHNQSICRRSGPFPRAFIKHWKCVHT